MMLWDTAKAVLRGEIISESVFIKKKKTQKLLNLQNQLTELEQKHSKSKDPQLLLQMRPLKQEIDKIYCDEIEKNLRFTKQRYYEAGSKAYKLLAWRLRKQQSENTVHTIRDSVTKKVTYKLEGIQKACWKFYQNLYTQPTTFEPAKVEEFLSQLDLPSLGKLQNEKLTEEISPKEAVKAISSLESSKSPGTDGFPGEWYKSLREQFIPILHKSFNYTLREGVIPPSWREATISVIPKEGKAPKECSSCRPISVLNQDYKLYATILSKRLEEVIPFLIDEDQTGFIKCRQTQHIAHKKIYI